MFNVIDIDKVDHQKINIKKPYIFKNFNNQDVRTFDLYHENKYLLLMTNTFQLYSKNNFCFDFKNNKNKGCLYHLNKLLDNILKRIQCIDEYKSIFENKNIIKNIKNQENCRILTIKNICNQDTIVLTRK